MSYINIIDEDERMLTENPVRQPTTTVIIYIYISSYIVSE